MNTPTPVQSSSVKSFFLGLLIGVGAYILMQVLFSFLFTFLSTVFSTSSQILGPLSIVIPFGLLVALLFVVQKKMHSRFATIGVVCGFVVSIIGMNVLFVQL